MHLEEERSQTLINLLWLAEKRSLSSGLRASAVTDSESPSRVDFMEALEESTMLIFSSQAQTRKEASEETA